jgi:phosphate acetyltransferase/phosphate butyryltransferase
MNYLENKTYSEIKIGDSAQVLKTLTHKDIDLFAATSGDVNPAHLDEEYASKSSFHQIIAHGMWGGALISSVLGTQLPGPGTIYVSQSLKFMKPIHVGDQLVITVTVTKKNDLKKRLVLDCTIINQHNEQVVAGEAEVIAPEEKIKRPVNHMPEVFVDEKDSLYKILKEKAKGLPPLKTAVVHPVDELSLLAVVESTKEGIIDPILIAPEQRLLKLASSLKINLDPYEKIFSLHSNHSAALGAQIAYEGRVNAIMKGAIHTDELMQEIVQSPQSLRTERRMSHIMVMSVPNYDKLLLITDAAINISPGLEEKKDIVQNAIDLATSLKINTPKVAILSAVETISPKIRTTIEAAALCKMVERGQIHGCIIDGPLAFDNAISKAAAKIKGINSPVSGQADILVVPDLEAGNMVVKQLEYFGHAQGAGVVLGAKVPIILTSRSDGVSSRVNSSLLAVVFGDFKKNKNF